MVNVTADVGAKATLEILTSLINALSASGALSRNQINTLLANAEASLKAQGQNDAAKVVEAIIATAK